ncbi:MAG: hypothetical protein L0Z55_12710 [Planctomycetes bacterium]|nr:hypothetical protein [Planctomycetota bacterium]
MKKQWTAKRTILLEPALNEQLGGAFVRKFFEAAVQSEPENLDCLVQLGDIYTRLGHYEKGLEIDSRLIKLKPEEPTFFYNLACSYSLLNRCTEALDALRRALELGYKDVHHLAQDEDLENLRDSPEFRAILKSHLS